MFLLFVLVTETQTESYTHTHNKTNIATNTERYAISTGTHTSQRQSAPVHRYTHGTDRPRPYQTARVCHTKCI